MKIIADVDTLQKYISGLMDRAFHHGKNVREIVLAMVGGIIWRKDGDIEVRTLKGNMVIALKFQIGGQTYMGGYQRDTKKIEIRKMGTGQVVKRRYEFDNSSTPGQILDFFKSL